MKKKLSRFFTLSRRHDAGFTLVELIVVIAILAILAGVGTVGYSGYIKNANKNNDKVLVGNIIRAIETGTYSTMFESDNSFTKGATTYPVGIIILSEEGCSVRASTSQVGYEEKECVMDTVTVLPADAYTTTPYENDVSVAGYALNIILSVLGIDKLEEKLTVYSIDTSKLKEVTYCTTHSTLCSQRTVYTNKETYGEYTAGKDKVSYYFEEDCKGIFALATDHVAGNKITQENLTGNETNRVIETTSSPIYESLFAAFGDPSNLSLSYSGWGDLDEEGHTYATLLTFTESMIADIKGTASDLMSALAIAEAAGKDISGYLSDKYDNAADMMDSFANYLIQKYPVYDDPNDNTSDWKAMWEGAAGGGVTYHFNLNATLDYCYAARISYNNAFASYCSANGIDNTYIEVLKDYHHVNSLGISIPDVTNTAAFANKNADDEDSLYAQFIAADSTNGAAAFDECALLFKSYKDSEVCRQNGEVFYTTMQTVADTGSEAYKHGAGGNDGYFAYYENLMKEMAAYYEYIKTYNGSGIIILVTVEDGLVKCVVSPGSANPRND